jgi:hypothetical protein
MRYRITSIHIPGGPALADEPEYQVLPGERVIHVFSGLPVTGNESATLRVLVESDDLGKSPLV